MSYGKKEKNPFEYSCNGYHRLLKEGPRSNTELRKTYGFFTHGSTFIESYDKYRADLETARLACEEERFYDKSPGRS